MRSHKAFKQSQDSKKNYGITEGEKWPILHRSNNQMIIER